MQLQKITALQNSVQLLVCTMQILSDAAILLLKSLNCMKTFKRYVQCD
jgi:hypothetical protein